MKKLLFPILFILFINASAQDTKDCSLDYPVTTSFSQDSLTEFVNWPSTYYATFTMNATSTQCTSYTGFGLQTFQWASGFNIVCDSSYDAFITIHPLYPDTTKTCYSYFKFRLPCNYQVVHLHGHSHGHHRLENMNAHGEMLSYEIYNLNGQKTDADDLAPGLYVEVITRTNNSIEISKILIQ